METKSDNRRRGRLDSVLNFAKKHGFETVIDRGEWNGFSVYELIISDEKETAYIGIPQYVLDDGKNMRISEPDEAFSILDSL